VERNGALRQVLVEALDELGFDVVAAGSRKQALDALLHADDPDLLLVDLVDDAAGGERLLSFVGEHEQLAAIPVIVMTDGAEPVEHAAADVLVKPFGIEELRAAALGALGAAGGAAEPPHAHR
jgi:CheY-like chemotaxis protein